MANYPPYLEGKLPAQYGNTLAIPFTVNRAHDANGNSKLYYMLKTATTSSSVLADGSMNRVEVASIKDNVAFIDVSSATLTPGLFYKIQLSFGKDGYYSNVGVFKYTSAEASLSFDNQQPGPVLIGKYYNPDNTEKVEYYKFDIYCDGKMIETSDWLPHNTTDDLDYTSSLDSYTMKTDLASGDVFIAYYYVRTTNNLELKPAISNTIQQGQVPFNEKAFNNFYIPPTRENGRIEIQANNAQVNGYFKFYRDNLLLKDCLVAKGQSVTIYDNTVEQGANHKYYVQQYSGQIFTTKYLIGEVFIEFDDAFLSDKDRQLCIRFNPKVTSFKMNLAESKVDTIGGKYPTFFRNGTMGYKEFPISGLISYLIDPDNLFMNSQSIDEFEQAQNLTNANFKRERDFKLAVLEWLNNGQPKLFRSPGEGNYLVRLMNVSLSPEEKLGRMLHTFSATAYEIADCSQENLVKYGFLEGFCDETSYGQVSSVDAFTRRTFNIADIEGTVHSIIISGAPGTIFTIDEEQFVMPYTHTYILEQDVIANLSSIESEEKLTFTYSYYKKPDAEETAVYYNDKKVIGFNYPIITSFAEIDSLDVLNIVSLQLIWKQSTEPEHTYTFTYTDGTTQTYECPYYISYVRSDLVNVQKVETNGCDMIAMIRAVEYEQEGGNSE